MNRPPRRSRSPQLNLIHDWLAVALFIVLFLGGLKFGVKFSAALGAAGLAAVGFLIHG